MIYKQTLVPDKDNHSIEMPEHFYGKRVEVIVQELNDSPNDLKYPLPKGKKTSANVLLEFFGAAPDFPSLEEIREKAWPSKW
jgi:hypothetical protein